MGICKLIIATRENKSRRRRIQNANENKNYD